MDKRSPVNSSSWQSIKPVQTRRQLATDPEMCMFALTVSIVEPKNIKEAMADSAWIEAMQEELHQFEGNRVWELVDKPFGKKCKQFVIVQDIKQDSTKNTSKRCISCPFVDTRQKHFMRGIQYPSTLIPSHPARYHMTSKNRLKTYNEYVALSRTEYIADMFTKALSEDRFQYLIRRIGMRCLTLAKLEVLTNESA
ncbi:hypothetical protein Tco_0730556 [Tanacetum coccineum]|uniref:Gag-Pol polyprotein n=1 Tax=Tanacetum coccineum TaxID=301880 RepID=A0ABQ4YT37_9ASTR